MPAPAEGRIDKIYQPERDEIVLSIRLMRGSVKLLLSAGAGSPRMHFIEKGRENPSAPPMFCMLLRKHLQGAKIVSVVSPDMERMAIITCDTVDEMGVPSKKYLAVELMGKYSNVILYDADGAFSMHSNVSTVIPPASGRFSRGCFTACRHRRTS